MNVVSFLVMTKFLAEFVLWNNAVYGVDSKAVHQQDCYCLGLLSACLMEGMLP